MNWTLSRITTGVRRRWLQTENNRRISRLAQQVARHAPASLDARPVAFFNASSRLAWMSQNAAFTLLTSWGLNLAGLPTVHFVCRAGMSRCMLGTNKDDPLQEPPCDVCAAQSGKLFQGSRVVGFQFQPDSNLVTAIHDLSVPDLQEFCWEGLPLGELTLPALRWALRRHHLVDDQPTRFFYREYILSAWQVAVSFRTFLDQVNPRAVVVFNGIAFPEATARLLAQQRGLPVITHEVGLQPFTGFFSPGQATAYPIDIPADFELSAEQNARLDAYLEQRLKGNFSMAGIRFWPEMQGLDEGFLKKAAGFKQIVPVFTNVIFDTSQMHANVVFTDMFAWLDAVLEIIRSHPETLFVVRAHPDESRPGKASRESVSDWVSKNRVTELPNVIFVDPDSYISSYELIVRSKFVMVYNSTIGLEAAIMGAAVLCGGKARFTQIPTVFFPESVQDFRKTAEDFLAVDQVLVPDVFRLNARKFLYFQLYRVSLPFGDYLTPDITPGFVRLRSFDWQALLPENSSTLRVLVEGIRDGKPFMLNGEEAA